MQLARQYVFAVGQIPGGQFQPVDIVCKGHLLYLFEGEGCRKPTSKPRGFFNIKRAEVTFIGLLQNPPLPPFTNVFKLTFASKQMAHKDWFFKAKTNREVNQWVADLSWRVKESEAQISAFLFYVSPMKVCIARHVFFFPVSL